MKNQNLNLTRKWRSKQFDQIVGQDLSVKILKNSLYKGYLFPVYLFSGQHGCGKTSVARIFASSINCQLLPVFQKDPQSIKIPCLTCVSCKAMGENNHPDFFEIDAASHTGVDNIRTIMDSSCLLPLMGKTKIYLIDEAHMLSKAAFNAFLKILEEPPLSVVFILATTDVDKIIDTVKSRCFQLFFKSVDSRELFEHLVYICQQESIKYEEQALMTIVKESHGSVRDALNCLEQVRFSSSVVSLDAVYTALGYVSDLVLLAVVSHVVQGSPARLLSFLQEQALHTFSMSFVWYRLIHIVRALMWAKHGVPLQALQEYQTELHHLARSCSWKLLTHLMEQFYAHELLFQKTTAQYELLEMILLRLCDHDQVTMVELEPSVSVNPEIKKKQIQVDVVQQKNQTMSDVAIESEKQTSDATATHRLDSKVEKIAEQSISIVTSSLVTGDLGLWSSFVQSLLDSQPFLHSIFMQGSFVSFDAQSFVVRVIFLQKHLFFKDMITDMESVWLPLLQQFFAPQARLELLFKDTEQNYDDGAAPEKKIDITEQEVNAGPVVERVFESVQVKKNYQESMQSEQADRLMAIDISDKDRWKKTHLLLKYFSGTVSEMRKTIYE